MDHLKKYIKLSMKMLNEADHYAQEYREAKMKDHNTDADMYHSLAKLHLDGYNKIKIPVAAHINQMKREDPKTLAEDMYMMVKDVEKDLENAVYEKLNK